MTTSDPVTEAVTVGVRVHQRLLPWTVRRADTWALTERHDRWYRECFDRHGIPDVEAFLRSGSAMEVVARATPLSVPERELVATGVMYSAMLLIDDVVDGGDLAQVEDTMNVAAGHDVGPLPPLMRVWAEATAAVRPFWTPQAWQRLLQAGRLWADAVIEARTSSVRATDLASYLQVRRRDIGFDWVDTCVQKYSLDLSVRAPLPHLARAQDASFRHMLLVNDLFSFRKEHFAGESLNAVAILMDCHRMSLQEAFDEVCRQITQAEHDLEQTADLRTPPPRSGHLDLTSYLEVWRGALAANLHFSLSHTRYHGPHHHWDGTIPTHITLHHDHTTFHTD